VNEAAKQSWALLQSYVNDAAANAINHSPGQSQNRASDQTDPSGISFTTCEFDSLFSYRYLLYQFSMLPTVPVWLAASWPTPN
jgi:hypothetical protein